MSASKHKEAGQDHEEIPTIKEMERWNDDHLLEWILRMQPDLFRNGPELRKFKAARIMGSTFLEYAGDINYFERTRLPLGVYSYLASLSRKVLEKNNQLKQTAGRKRKGDETEAPEEPPISPKRHHLEDDTLSDLAARARERRKLIREIITDMNRFSDQHSSSVAPSYPFPGAVDKLSDPAFDRKFPFPFVGSAVPNRFKLADDNWQYVGRTKFKQLRQTVEDVRVSKTYTTTWLYGTQGYGKSHLLAALVCYLAAQDVWVVYIPDCRELLKEFIEYVRAAMLFAWADDITTQEVIMALETEEDIRRFFSDKRDVTGSKARGWWLKRFAYRHNVIFSSANYTDYLEQSIKQNSNFVLQVYGGLDKTEMDRWWDRRGGIDMGGYEKSQVEDTTGRIPLLLDMCVVDNKIDLTRTSLKEVHEKAVSFVQEISTVTQGTPKWKWYCDFMTACFYHNPVPSGWYEHLTLVDHRYFYRYIDNSEWCGGYTCGLVRDAVAEELLLDQGVDFADTDFLLSLDRFIDNPSVLSFIIEHAVLLSIRSHGLAIGAGIKKPMVLRHLKRQPEFEKDATDKPVLYRPKIFNFKAIDGIIICIKPEENEMAAKTNEKSDEKNETAEEMNKKNDEKSDEKDKEKKAKEGKKKLLMFPIRITLAPASHSDSHAKFFEAYGKWITDISKFDVELEFLWISPELCDSQDHPASKEPPWPAHKERYVPLKTVNNDIWEKYERVKKKMETTQDAKPKAAKRKVAPAKAAPTEVATTKGATTKAATTKAATTKAAQTETAQTETAPTRRKPGATKSRAKQAQANA